MECRNHNLIFVKRKSSNGVWMLNKQCLECGMFDSKAYAHNIIKINEIQEANIHLKEAFEKIKYNEAMQESTRKREEFYLKREEDREEYYKNKTEERQSWLDNVHTPYLKSNEWKEKRKKVLFRDKFTCQACLINEANEVHHLTYKHYKQEPLFELISMCSKCHINLTKQDREL